MKKNNGHASNVQKLDVSRNSLLARLVAKASLQQRNCASPVNSVGSLANLPTALSTVPPDRIVYGENGRITVKGPNGETAFVFVPESQLPPQSSTQHPPHPHQQQRVAAMAANAGVNPITMQQILQQQEMQRMLHHKQEVYFRHFAGTPPGMPPPPQQQQQQQQMSHPYAHLNPHGAGATQPVLHSQPQPGFNYMNAPGSANGSRAQVPGSVGDVPVVAMPPQQYRLEHADPPPADAYPGAPKLPKSMMRHLPGGGAAHGLQQLTPEEQQRLLIQRQLRRRQQRAQLHQQQLQHMHGAATASAAGSSASTPTDIQQQQQQQQQLRMAQLQQQQHMMRLQQMAAAAAANSVPYYPNETPEMHGKWKSLGASVESSSLL